MNSRPGKLIRRLSAATSFTLLAIAPLCQAQQTESPTALQLGEAKIRIRTESDTAQEPKGQFEFKPVPTLTKKVEAPANASLLSPRFRGFPKVGQSETNTPVAQTESGKFIDKTIAAQASPSDVDATLGWQAPVTMATFVQDADQPAEQPVVQDPVVALPPAVPQVVDQPAPPQQPAAQDPAGVELATFDPEDGTFTGLQGKVKIIVDEQTGKLRVIGSEADIAIVEAEIKKILESTETEERIPERIPLRYSDSEELAESIRNIYDEEYSGKVGNAEIIPLSSPNAFLVFGSQGAIDAVREIVNKIESDVQPEDAKDFASFSLKHVSASDAKRRLEDYFTGGDRGEAFPIGAWTVVADYRSNTVVVRGNAQVQQQAKLLIEAIDVDEEVLTKQSMKVFQLQNAVAGDLAIILYDAINGTLKNVPQPLQNNTQGGGIQPAQPAQDGNEFSSEPAPSKVELQTVGQGGKISSGLLYDVRITPDSSSNSLIVRGPSSAMPLIEELIRQLDRLPNAETLIKVFQIVNGDAEQLLTMLEAIFGADDQNNQVQNQNGSLSQLPLQTASATPGSALVNLRFAIEQRTNSIIATGPAGDLQVVEDLLNRLDEDLRTRRETVVYRLSNSNVLDVEEALNNLLDSRSDVLANDPRAAGGAVLADQEIVIVPELGSNSLIISSLPENFPEIEAIIRRLDRRPPMVRVKVLMAEVDLNSLEEFGVELGIQDSLLFDRSTTVDAAGGITGTGFDFNPGTGVANLNSVSPNNIAGQALSTLGLGRSNANLGYGGLVLSAGNESASVLMRALKDRGCLRVLSRPHIMTLENLQGRVSVGQVVPRIGETNQNGLNGQISNSIEEVEVGVILEITPRVSPDGMITMFVNVVKSSLGAEADGPAVAVAADGTVIRQAPIDAVEAQTTIISRSGQTVVFSGLIQESKQHVERGAPILSDLPVIGPLFKFESDIASRSELLIIMTPYLVDTEGEIQAHNAEEMDRMHWCLSDVAEIYGSTGYDPMHAETESIQTHYPVEGGEYWSSENGGKSEAIGRIAQTEEKSGTVKPVGFLQKMKLSIDNSPVGKLGDRIRGHNEPNQNRRNRRDFEELKRLRSQHQE